MASAIRRHTNGIMFGALLALACGNGDDLVPEPEPEEMSPPVVEVVEMVEVVPPDPPPVDPPVDAMEMVEDEVDPSGVGTEPGAPCSTPDRVSGAPTSIPEAIVLMNALPKPTSLECFLQSLTRPLALFMTSSPGSLQPSPGARSPRTFIVNDKLAMSIVFDGEAHDTLELGFRTAIDRSIKTEILFPLEQELTLERVFDRVIQPGEGTMCGRCHIGEILTTHAAFPSDVFESNVIEPAPSYEVGLEALMSENDACNPDVERARCDLLSAVFDHGEVRATTLDLTDPDDLQPVP